MYQIQELLLILLLDGEVTTIDSPANPEQLRLNKLWNEGGLEGKLQFAQEMQNMEGVKGDPEKIEIYRRLAEELTKLIKLRKEFDSIENFGLLSMQDWVKRQREVAKSLNGLYSQRNAFEKRFKEMFSPPGSDTVQGELSNVVTELNNSKQVLDQKSQIMISDFEKMKKVRDELTAKMNEWEALGKSTDPKDQASYKDPKWLTTLGNLGKQLSILQNNANNSFNAFVSAGENSFNLIEKQRKLQADLDNFFKGGNDNLAEQIQLQRLLIQGKMNEYTCEKLISEARKKNISILDEHRKVYKRI